MWVGKFAGSGALPAPWRVVQIDKKTKPTIYRLATVAGVAAVEARANDSMALLARPLSVDLAATPILCWRWLVDAPVARGDMTKKSGDDYAARLYVAFDMPDSAMSAWHAVQAGRRAAAVRRQCSRRRAQLCMGQSPPGRHPPQERLHRPRAN